MAVSVEVQHGVDKELGGLAQVADSGIATRAEESARGSASVTVVDVKLARRALAADGAAPALRSLHGLETIKSETVPSEVVPVSIACAGSRVIPLRISGWPLPLSIMLSARCAPCLAASWTSLPASTTEARGGTSGVPTGRSCPLVNAGHRAASGSGCRGRSPSAGYTGRDPFRSR